MTKDQISHLVSRVYATEETELDCGQVQELLPAYAEALAGNDRHASLEPIHIHLVQCSDCNESFLALRHLAALEESAGLPEADQIMASWSEDTDLETEPSASAG